MSSSSTPDRSEHPLVRAYRAFSPGSETRAQRADRVFPGGDTRASAHYGPYPLAMQGGNGCRLQDVDGHDLIDFMNNFTSLIHGHAFAPIVEAVQRQVARGTAYAASSDEQVELAELIAARVPSVQRLRFTSSGTEATQMAIRCARAATGRDKIMKMEGGYHGSYELAEVSLVARPNERGPLETPVSLPVDNSFPASVLRDTIICPYNQPQLARDLVAANADQLAAIIVEPMLGSMGMVAATTEFLTTLRELASAHSIVLIFDEVITLRLDEGGAQALHGVIPDLTCMGKIIGGGLPVGAVGGREDLMHLFSPEHAQPVMHASTFSGNALTMAAGIAAMQAYTQADAQRLNQLGERLRDGFNQTFLSLGLKARAIGEGSLSNILFSDEPVNDARDAMDAMIRAGHIGALLHLGMLRHGVMSASRLMYCTSTPMNGQHIEHAVQALHDTLVEMLPYIEQERPNLLQ